MSYILSSNNSTPFKSIFFPLILCLLFMSASAKSQSKIISIEETKFQVDEFHRIIVSQIENIEAYNNLQQYVEVQITQGKDEYSFNSVPASLAYSDSYPLTRGSDKFTLYITQLPIITINSKNSIVDEPKVSAEFTYSDSSQYFTSFIGIELRGGYSLTFPKKTFDFELRLNESGQVSKDWKFGNLRLDDDWVLDALYNEPLRIRSNISHKLWLQIHQPHYSDIEPFAKSGANVMFVELFLNGSYNGVYLLSEQVDKKLLKLQDFDGSIRGEMYKSVSWGGACTFDALPVYNNNSRYWGGYDYKYPDETEITDWSELYNFTDFVMNSSNEAFKSGIWNQFSRENCMDYFIFLNLIKASDNRGKNIYLAKHDQLSTYFYTPWDLDACFGIEWQGINDPDTKQLLTNGLFKRAYDLNAGSYRTAIGNKWHEYRIGVLSTETLEKSFTDTYNYLVDNNVYERESIVYPNYNFDLSSFAYMLDWLHKRLGYLDSYFVITTDIEQYPDFQNQKGIVYPNPADDYIKIRIDGGIKDPSYRINDLSGKIVQSGRADENTTIRVSELNSGLYFIEIDNITMKVIVK